MLCRRCGMESSTTDVCEWCRRPMLPAGESVTGREGKAAGAGNDGRPAPAPTGTSGLETGRPLAPEAEEPSAPEAEEPGAPERQAEKPGVEHVLQPLGATPKEEAPQSRPRAGGPTHGLSDDATRTSVDVSQYSDSDESIFRPIEREEGREVMGGADPLAMRRGRRKGEEGLGSEISENVRLLRSVVAGVGIAILVTLVQMIVAEEGAPNYIYGWAFRRQEGIITVVVYGILVGLIYGLGLGALLVRLKKGPFLGLVLGLLVGLGLKNSPYSLIAGGLAGIVIGVIATRGLRRVITV